MDCDLPELLANLTPLGLESKLWKSRGHIPQVPATDICYSLAKIKYNGPEYLLRIKYAGEDRWLAQLEYLLWRVTMEIATKRNWKTPTKYRGTEPFRRACRLAIWEHIHPHVCPTCLGRGQAVIESKLIVCEECHGSMRIIPNDDMRLRLLEIGGDWPEFAERYARILAILQKWEMYGLTKMAELMAELNE